MGDGLLIVAFCEDHAADWQNPRRMPRNIDPMRLRFTSRGGQWPSQPGPSSMERDSN